MNFEDSLIIHLRRNNPAAFSRWSEAEIRDSARHMEEPDWLQVVNVDTDDDNAIEDLKSAQAESLEIRANALGGPDRVKKFGTPKMLDVMAFDVGLKILEQHSDPADVRELIRQMKLNAFAQSTASLQVLCAQVHDRGFIRWIQATAMWAKNAFPFLCIADEIFASNLASTKVPSDIADDIVPPWDAFRISVPPGLLVSADDRYERMMVNQGNDGLWNITLEGRNGHSLFRERCKLRHLCDQPEDFRESIQIPEFSTSEAEDRVLHMASRIMLALCIKMSDKDTRPEERRSPLNRHPGRRSFNAPIMRKYLFTKPNYIHVDCRKAVSEYLGGGGKTPSVKVLVRGHWKRQVCGERMKDRKFIQVQPYWRGDESLPMSVKKTIVLP